MAEYQFYHLTEHVVSRKTLWIALCVTYEAILNMLMVIQ